MIIPENKLIITIGCPGAGKSTWADQNLSPWTLRLERDRFREALFGTRRAYHNSPLDHGVRSDVITASMSAAMQSWPNASWAITDTGLTYRAVLPFINYAEYWNVPIRLVVFDRSIEYLTMCNKVREHAHRIPDDILLEMIALYHDPEAWWRHAGYETIMVP